MESLRIAQKRRCAEQKPTMRTEQVAIDVINPIEFSVLDQSTSINPITITGGPSTYTITFPDLKPTSVGRDRDYYHIASSHIANKSVILSIVLPAISDSFPTAIQIGEHNVSTYLFTGFGLFSPGVYKFTANGPIVTGTYTYSAGQILSLFLSDGLQTLSINGVQVASTFLHLYPEYGWDFFIDLASSGTQTTPVSWILSLADPQTYVTRFVGKFGTCIQKRPDKPNVIESQRVIRERCQQIIVNGLVKTVPIGCPAVYVPVQNTNASQTTSALKDAITATEPRFYEFIKPRPLPPDFLQVARQVSNAGEPLAKNTACALGEIKTVG
jgi:hypothetical protein